MDVPGAPRGLRPPTIGVLVNWFGDVYSTPIIAGILDVARERGTGVVCFAGGRPASMQRYESAANVAFDLIGEECVDGLILIAGTLVQRFGFEELTRLTARHSKLPIVSVALELPGCSNVLVDNERGLREIVIHLIADHRYRRIGFVRGPATSPEAELRFRVYREVMAEHGLSIDPDWILPGMFDDASGARAIEILYDERTAPLEALVVANDQMALAAVEALASRGVAIPEQLAVVGFDDTEMSSFATPPLTTVRQPLYKIGRRAAVTLLDRLEGESRTTTITLPTEAVLRESCGCPIRPSRTSSVRPAAGNPPTWELFFEHHRAGMVAEIASSFDSPALASEPWLERLVESFAAELGGKKEGSFVKYLEQTLRRVTSAGEDVWPWQKLVPLLERTFLPWLGRGTTTAAQADELLGQARLVVGDVARRAQAHKRLTAERRAHTLSNISQALISSLDLRELTTVLGAGLPELDVKSCFLSLYDDPQEPARMSRLVFCFDQAKRPASSNLPIRFPSRQLVPSDQLPKDRPLRAVLEPLYFKQEQLGFILLELGPPEGPFYDELRQQLSSALMRLAREEELLRLHTAEKERSRELEQAYRAMQENQEKLLISEKMAALGRLSAGIAHEMNTPLAAVRTALEELGKLAEEYRLSFADARVTPDDHREIAGEMLSTVRLASGAAEKVAGFVQGIKFQTREIAGQEPRRFNAIPVIQDTLLLLHHLLRNSGCTISFEHPEAPVEIFGLPGRLAQVVTNLVTNAIDASEAKGGGPIALSLRPLAGRVELEVVDAGAGIAPELMKRIFDPMFTTKPFGQGTGLGLTIVHDIVSSEFSGSIEVESRLGAGTTFTVTLASMGHE
jgi:DNA-binding LacI/PurR family transcriptional regulator/signal transduction histidine kinase